MYYKPYVPLKKKISKYKYYKFNSNDRNDNIIFSDK